MTIQTKKRHSSDMKKSRGQKTDYAQNTGCKVNTYGITLHFKSCLECPFPKCRHEVHYDTFMGWVAEYIHGKM